MNTAMNTAMRVNQMKLFTAIYENDLKKCVELVDTDTTLVNFPSESGKPPLYHAIDVNNKEICKLLLDRGANLGKHCILSVWHCEYALDYAVFRNKIEMCKLLIEYGANPNDEDYTKNNALHYAVEFNNWPICELLIKSGANINQQNDKKNTPLCRSAWRGLDTICINLLQAGADPFIKCKDGATAYEWACKYHINITAAIIFRKIREYKMTQLFVAHEISNKIARLDCNIWRAVYQYIR